MTKVQVHYDLERPLDEHMLTCISAAHGIYGMARITPTPDLRGLVVDYDASRLTIREVEAALLGAGIPLTVRA